MNVGVISNNIHPQTQSFRSKKSDGEGGPGKAFASIIPGLGQLLDGRTSTGAFFMGTSVAGMLLFNNLIKDAKHAVDYEMKKLVYPSSEKNGKLKVDFTKKNNIGAAELYKKTMNSKSVKDLPSSPKVIKASYLAIGLFGLWIANLVDAYKGAKKN